MVLLIFPLCKKNMDFVLISIGYLHVTSQRDCEIERVARKCVTIWGN